ncbi:MAG: hypothetical protein COW00_19265 [Bdellovibrio sp. CG12_big_fil_rev_8_21_14_0_65_39_13]|nr:MAG: hypothetical protein COW78_01330 [Bdellovibrio sp. CG22_combo_CG10-13_8_21_14_all_39_27]PIQ57702.1 MAG: hypothetical protein COW00_19265 [Bdellovibrio sp. CG12_big_fil_rev_8_21_14_0_65_39_13]PIR36570.1 MAG: hypothetical protein COV37_02710 [Bdellovibrio sp. CG11_big_fil_rev_8_21_14_0_20_39_38]PJB52860.1 MAG: hypothetical protein CO099_10360 [Bdellovibrio sp. CG_4_9_14_3_um_filter_39_7]
MILSNINLNLLRVFDSVYRAQSMTKAALELHMTQSGVSQNIKNLEELLDVALFDRIKQKPVPTAKAHQLYQVCGPYLLKLEDTLADIKGIDIDLRGKISIGIPIEFGNSIVLPLLAKWLQQHPEIEAKLTYGWASAMNGLLLDGGLDFAFVDNYAFDKQIEIETVWNETLMLCASTDYMKKIGPYKHDRKFYEKCEYLDYAESGELLINWFHHHLGSQVPELKMRASLMDVQGLAKLIINGTGLGILPEFTVNQLMQNGHELVQIEGSGNALQNPISLAMTKNRTQSKMVRETMEYLKTEIKNLA